MNVAIDDLPFEFTPSPMMAYHNYAIKQMGNHLTVAYLADDDQGENPMEYSDGYGMVYTAHRHASKDDHDSMQEALGLDSDWEPSLSILEKSGTVANRVFRKTWIEAASRHVDFALWADETGRKVNPDQAYYRRRAVKFWRDCEVNGWIHGVDIWHFDFTHHAAHAAWAELRSKRLIGNPDVVVLDCYSHGGECWSISGEGTQCRFDTSQGAGVWVPDEVTKGAIDAHQMVYAFGDIECSMRQWKVILDGKTSKDDDLPTFPSWREAFEWLAAHADNCKKPTAAMLKIGRDRARHHACENALETFNAWLSGECYGVVVAQFCNNGTEADPVWECVSSEECWGYIGSDSADELPGMLH